MVGSGCAGPPGGALIGLEVGASGGRRCRTRPVNFCTLRVRPLIALHIRAGQELDSASLYGGAVGKSQKFRGRCCDGRHGLRRSASPSGSYVQKGSSNRGSSRTVLLLDVGRSVTRLCFRVGWAPPPTGMPPGPISCLLQPPVEAGSAKMRRRPRHSPHP